MRKSVITMFVLSGIVCGADASRCSHGKAKRARPYDAMTDKYRAHMCTQGCICMYMRGLVRTARAPLISFKSDDYRPRHMSLKCRGQVSDKPLPPGTPKSRLGFEKHVSRALYTRDAFLKLPTTPFAYS